MMHILLFLQKFENRGIVVKQSEMKYWEKLCIDDMSEESDDPNDPNTLIVHKLQWRSQGTKPCILLQVMREFVSVIQVTGDFVLGTTSHMHCVWTWSEMREQTCDLFWHSFVLWWCLYTGLTKSTHQHCTFGPISCIGSKFTWMSTYPGAFVAVCIVSVQHE